MSPFPAPTGSVRRLAKADAASVTMNGIETATTSTSKSTGTMMRGMVLRGPSSYDSLCVYESVVIDYLKSAEGR
jgi:hypothetical protein